MKRIVCLTTFVTILLGCTNKGTKIIEGCGDTSQGIRGYVSVKEIVYNNHRYLEFKDEGMYGQGWVHDPECPNPMHDKK